MKQELEWRQARDLLLAETEPAGEEQLPLEAAEGWPVRNGLGMTCPPLTALPMTATRFRAGIPWELCRSPSAS